MYYLLFFISLMNKIIRLFLVALFAFFGFTFASEQILLNTVIDWKNKIEKSFDDSYSSIYTYFQTSVTWIIHSMDYQGLVCLWIIDDKIILQSMQEDYKNLKLWFLNAYSIIYSDVLDIEQKKRILDDTSVSLFSSWSNYEKEKSRILSNLKLLIDNQKISSDQFASWYILKINQFVKDFNDYSIKNKSLLESISVRIQTIQLIEKEYKKLQSDLFWYQSKLAWTWSKIFSKFDFIKNIFSSWLDTTFDRLIKKEIKRYTILGNLATELEQQKSYALKLFGLQFDEKLNILLDKWYDNKQYTKITKDIQNYINSYSSWWRLQCSSFVAADDFTKKSESLLKIIYDFPKEFSLSSGYSTNQFHKTISQRIPVIDQLQKDITVTFKKTILEKRQYLLNEYKKKSDSSLNTITSPQINIPSSFLFTRTFNKWESHSDISILQQLLTKLWYYQWIIDWINSQSTIQALYKYQLANNLLKWYENKPAVWWWMGPSTRAQLNKDLYK